MATDVLIDPTSGQIYWNDGTGSPESIAIKGDAINTISFTGYSASFSPGSTPAGALTLVTVKDSAGTDALIPGTTGYNLGSSTLRWNTFSSNANLSGTLVVSDSTISSSLLTGSTKINGGIAISGNASIGQSLNFYNTAATFYTGFIGAQSGVNTTYTLPTTSPATGTSVLQSDTSGTLSWVGSIGTATTATNINVVSATTSASHPVLFTPASGTASGAALSTKSTFVYNPSTDILSVSGLAVTSTTASTNSGTGALRVAGGVGISGELRVDNSSASLIASFKTDKDDFGYIDIQNRNSGSNANSQLLIRNNDNNNNTLLIGLGSTNETLINTFNGSNIPRGFGYIISNTGGISFNSNVGGLSVGAGSTLILFAKGPGHRLTLSGTGLSIFANVPSTSTTTGGLTVVGGVGIGGSIFGGSTISAADNIEIKSGKELRLNNSGNTFYTGIKAGANTVNYTLSLPTAPVGAGSSVIVTGSDGQIYYAAPGSGIAFSSATANTPIIRARRPIALQFSAGYTPAAAGADTVILRVPESATDGTTALTYNLRRFQVRVETPSAGSSRLQLERSSTDTGAFTLAATGSSHIGGLGVTIVGAGIYLTSVTTFSGSFVTSGNLLRLSWTLLNATHASFSVQLLLEEV